MKRTWYGRPLAPLQGFAVAAMVLLTLTSCGPKEEPAAPEQTAPPETAKALPPATRVLQLMPEQASVGAVILSPARLADKAVATAKRFTTDDAAIDAMVTNWVAAFAADLGVPEATTVAEVAAAAGIDGSAPVGVFFDLQPPPAAKQEAATLPQPEESAAEPDLPDAEDGDPESPQASDEALNQMLKELEQETDASLPPMGPLPHLTAEGAVAVVLECTDVEKMRALFENSSDSAEGQAVPAETSSQDGVTIVHHPDGDRFYLVAGNRFVAGNSLELVKGAAARFSDPIKVRYASPDCPADDSDEVVALVRTDKALPSLLQLSQVAAGMGVPGGLNMAEGGAGYLAAYEGEDPWIVSLALDETRLEFLARVDGATHPGIAKLKGAVGPLAQAPLFPESLLALLSLSLTPEGKKTLQETWFGAIPEESKKSPDVAQALGTTQLVLASIGTEITLGIGPSETGLPILMGAVDLVNTEQTKLFLQTFGLPMDLQETYSDVDILAAPIPLPMDPPQSAYFAFPQNMLVLGNDLGELKTALDRLRDGSPSDLFATLEPPLDPGVPREALLLVRGEFLSGVVAPLLRIQGLLDPSTAATLAGIEEVVGDVRYEKELAGTWYRDKLTVRLNEAAVPSAGASPDGTGTAG